MICEGRSLFAAKANGRWFVKQARSARQFVAMCVADERKNGYQVHPRHRDAYRPDFVYDASALIWRWADGRPYGPKLPKGAR